MMQSAQSRHEKDVAIGASGFSRLAAGGHFLRHAKMSSVVVVITDVIGHEAFQVPHIQNDHIVEQIPAAGAYPSLGETVLPRTAVAGSLRLNAECLHGIDHLRIKTRTAIKDQVVKRRVVRECLAQLLNDPGARRDLVTSK